MQLDKIRILKDFAIFRTNGRYKFGKFAHLLKLQDDLYIAHRVLLDHTMGDGKIANPR